MIETTETLVKTMESILEEREASRTKEKEAVESLNTVLQRMGYQIVPLQQNARKRHGRARAAEVIHPAGESNTHGDVEPRRRGRPRKTQAEEELVS